MGFRLLTCPFFDKRMQGASYLMEWIERTERRERSDSIEGQVAADPNPAGPASPVSPANNNNYYSRYPRVHTGASYVGSGSGSGSSYSNRRGDVYAPPVRPVKSI